MKTVRLIEQMRLAHTHIMLERTYKAVTVKFISCLNFHLKSNRARKFISCLNFHLKSNRDSRREFSSELFLALSNYRAMKSAVFASDKSTQRKWR